MSPSLLHVYAVNEDLGEMRHTHLTRAQEGAQDGAQDGPPAGLPPLADWLGVAVDADAVELFPVKDLKPLKLTDYLRDGFDVEDKTLAPHASRLSALQGHVLLVPDRALHGAPESTAALTAIATLPLPSADHSQTGVPKLPDPPPAAEAPEDPAPAKKPMSDARMSGMVAMAALAVLFGLVLVMVLIA